MRGNPINASNGNKYESETDYVGSGPNPLTFVRSYNSLQAWAAANGQMYPMTALGAGWTATYFQSLQIVTATTSTSTSTTVFAYRPDGRRLTFNLYNGVYSPDGDVADSLAQSTTGEWVYQTSGDTIETYDSNGMLLSIARRGQSPLTLSYKTQAGPGDPPLSVSDVFGHSLAFHYVTDSQGVQRLGSITDPAGGTVQYAYSNGTLISATYQDGSSRQYGYGSTTGTALISLTDEAGVGYATWTYNSGGSQALSSQHAGGVDSYSFSYSESGTSGSVTETDPLGKTRIFSQQLIQGVWRSSGTNAYCSDCGEDASRTFDASGNILGRTDLNGNQTTYIYDVTRNEETSRTEAYGTALARTITTQWDANWRQPTLIVEPNRRTAFTYDSMGNVLTKTVTDTTISPNLSRTWTYTYSSYGQVLTAKGPRTDVNSTTTYTYYSCTTGAQCGQVQTVMDAVGHVWTYNSYNAHGQPLTITDPNGVVTTLTYEARQRLTSRSASGETTGFSYYATGLLHTVTLPDSSVITYTYDGAHRLTQISDSLGNRIAYTLDAMGNRTAENVSDPNGVLHRTHSRVFNALSELYQDINAAGTAAVTTTYGYDSEGNQTSVAAPLSRTTGNAYDALNRLKQVTDPAGGMTQFGYDANDNLISVVDPRSLTTSYTNNGFGDLVNLSSPDTGTTVTTYDSAGNLATSTDARGAVATYGYDVLNRPTSVAYQVGGVTDQSIAFTYDAGTNGIGHLTGASDANHSLAWSYDALGRVTGKTQTVGSLSQSVGYAYTNGDLTSITTPAGRTITYGYNTNHQVISVAVGTTTVLNGVAYEPFGGVDGWTWGNGSATVRTFDTDGDISNITSSMSRSYSYDSAKRITGITDNANSALSWVYGYDTLDRLTSAGASSQSEGFAYDANGNRTSESATTTSSSTTTYAVAASSNQLSSVSGGLTRTYSYDAAGHTTAYGTFTFSYNGAGRLSSVTGGTSGASYIYNGLGQRVKKTTASGTTLFVYDESGHLLGEYDATGAPIQEIVWLGDTPVATIRLEACGLSIFYIHTDHLNTPRRITRRTTSDVVWSWDGEPFGTAAANENPSALGTFSFNLRFPGQYYDAETGGAYNMARDYDPAVGRYVESDPIGLRGGINTYGYVADQPSRRIDPSGLFALSVGAFWGMVDSLPGTRGGLTNYEIKNRCTCKGSCGSWTLSGCSSVVVAKVDLLSGVSDPNEAAFYRNGEAQHVGDLYAGAGAIYQAGAGAERSVRESVFSSKLACESNALNVVSAAVKSAASSVAQASVDRWDKSGLHTWYGAPWRILNPLNWF